MAELNYNSDTKPTVPTTVFDVIYTFRETGQLRGQVTFAGKPSEAQMLKGLLNGLSTRQTHELVKISTCQLYVGEDGVLPWVKDNPREGKYYFGFDFDEDELVTDAEAVQL